MAPQGSPRVSNKTRSASLIELAATSSRLVPKQLKDTGALLTAQLKSKGVAMGAGVGLAVLGLVSLMVTFFALVVALIDAFNSGSSLWFPALMVALVSFLLGLILIGVGVSMVASNAPAIFSETIHGLKHDLGYIREGNAFDPVEFDRLEAEKRQREAVRKEREKQLAKEAKKKQKEAVRRGEAAGALPDRSTSADELRHRMELRRRHLGDIRSGVDEKTDVAAQWQTFTSHATGAYPEHERAASLSPLAPYTTAARAGEKVNEGREYVKDNWQALGLLGASVTTMAVLAQRLRKKK